MRKKVLCTLVCATTVTAVGLIGLTVIVLATAFTGITEEHRLAHAFQEALPFTALLVVFFAIVAVIHDQSLFTPIVDGVLSLPRSATGHLFHCERVPIGHQ